MGQCRSPACDAMVQIQLLSMYWSPVNRPLGPTLRGSSTIICRAFWSLVHIVQSMSYCLYNAQS